MLVPPSGIERESGTVGEKVNQQREGQKRKGGEELLNLERLDEDLVYSLWPSIMVRSGTRGNDPHHSTFCLFISRDQIVSSRL